MRNIFRIFFLTFFCLTIQNNLVAQSVIEDLDDNSFANESYSDELVEETIVKISPSKRVFILTNDNNGFNKGDFISLILEDKLVNRAIVAKMAGGVAGIKIVKIYSLALWNKLRPGSRVKVLRGDDSYFNKKPEQAVNTDGQIQEEEDLFNDTVLDEDIDLEEKNNRLIKPDNIISLAYGTVSSIDINRDTTSYFLLTGSWAYQVSDNVWGELVYGQTVVRDFPNLELDTTLSSVSVRLKYTVEAPFDSYVKPYVGYQMISANSPDAGSNASTTVANEELDLVDLAGTQGLVFGVTFLKRLVPAWFIKVDFGTDMLAGGLALEF